MPNLPPFFFIGLALVAASGAGAAYGRARLLRRGGAMRALPAAHGWLGGLAAISVALCGWGLQSLLAWPSFLAEHLAALAVAGVAVLAALATARRGVPAARINEQVMVAGLWLCAAVAVLTTAGILFSLLFEALRFFAQVPLGDFLFGLRWSPQMASQPGQPVDGSAFGAVPLLAGTMMITVIALLVAAPLGLMSAIYLSEYAARRTRAVVKPALEILAGIPTVVYGFFAVTVVAPFLRRTADTLDLAISTESALAAGTVMGIMIIPFISSLSDDVISAVPGELRSGALALGATKDEMIRQVVLPAALPGVVGAFLLALSRAIGETMIVVMAAGLAANLTLNPLEAVTTVTVQIVKLLVGDQEFDNPKTLAAFALGLLLFCITLALNVIALKVVRKYREKYD